MARPEPKGELLRGQFLGFALVMLAALLAGVALEWWPLLLLPVGLLGTYAVLVQPEWLFWSFWFFLPFSTEIYFSHTLATNFPSEPLMLLLTGLGALWFIRRAPHLRFDFFLHPAAVLLLLGYVWMWVSAGFSANGLVSLKFGLAKTWFLVSLWLMPVLFLRKEQDYRRWVWLLVFPVFLTTLYVLVKHATLGFEFEEVNRATLPFYRNKVMYSAFLVVLLPFFWFATYWYRRFSSRWWLLAILLVIMVVGIQFSYTRATMGCLLIMIFAWWLIRKRLLKWVLGIAVVGLVAGLFWLTQQNKYLDFAPEYEKTVAHTRFDNLLEATLKGRDISSMERVYRWVAGGFMLGEQPVTGFGPGTFYFFYKKYTVNRFRTYVSDNPERSGIHNYYLMLAVEQGLPGLLLYLGFIVVVLLRGEHCYHQLQIPWQRRLVMAALLSLVSVHVLQVINDMLETDKIGAVFFLCTAIVIKMDVKTPGRKAAEA